MDSFLETNDENLLISLQSCFNSSIQRLQKIEKETLLIASSQIFNTFKTLLIDGSLELNQKVNQAIDEICGDEHQFNIITLLHFFQEMTNKLHQMLLKNAEGLRLPNYEHELSQMASSAKQAYELFIPLIKLMTLEYERTIITKENSQELNINIPNSLINFLQDMHQQINSSNIQFKNEILNAVTASGKFITEAVNAINAALNQFHQFNIKTTEPRCARYIASQNDIITFAMNSLKSLIKEMKMEIQTHHNKTSEQFVHVGELLNEYETRNDRTIASLESLLNQKLIVEMNKLQLNMSNQFNNLTPQFRQICDKIVEQNIAILHHSMKIESLPAEIRNQFSTTLKHIDDTLNAANNNLIDNMRNVLIQQADYLNQILQDTELKIKGNLIPLIAQTKPLQFDGNDQCYSILKLIPDDLMIIKNMVQESFNQNQIMIQSIKDSISKGNNKLELLRVTHMRDFFSELTNETEKNVAIQMKA
jgi:hypothetical protein